MANLYKSTAAALVGLGALALLGTSAIAAGTATAQPALRLAHMGQGPGMMGPGYGYGAGPGYGMGPGMMGPGCGYGPGQGYGMNPGMMGMMGPGMMGPGYGYGPGPGYGMGPAARPDMDLSADDVRARLERSLSWHGNKRVRVGEVKEADKDTIVADIVTVDGSLVDRLKIDRHSGLVQRGE
jgi:hypothetical protein